MVQDDWSDFVLRIGKLLKEPDIGVVFTEARPLTDDRVHMSRVRVVISNWRVGIAAQKINRCWQKIANTDLTSSRGLDANANLRLIVRSNEEVLLYAGW